MEEEEGVINDLRQAHCEYGGDNVQVPHEEPFRGGLHKRRKAGSHWYVSGMELRAPSFVRGKETSGHTSGRKRANPSPALSKASRTPMSTLYGNTYAMNATFLPTFLIIV